MKDEYKPLCFDGVINMPMVEIITRMTAISDFTAIVVDSFDAVPATDRELFMIRAIRDALHGRKLSTKVDDQESENARR